MVDEYGVEDSDWSSRVDLQISFAAIDHVHDYRISGAGLSDAGTPLDFAAHNDWNQKEACKAALLYRYLLLLWGKSENSRFPWLATLKFHMACARHL